MSRRAGIRVMLFGVDDRLQREGPVIHVVAERLIDLTGLLRRLEAVPPAAGPLPVAVCDFH